MSSNKTMVRNKERGSYCSAILMVRGCSVTVLTPYVKLEKETALANSHWICTGRKWFQFFAKFNVIFLVTYLIKSASMWTLILYPEKKCVILNFLITFNNFYIDFQWTASSSGMEANQRPSSKQPKQPIANRDIKFVTSVWPGECNLNDETILCSV